MKGQILAGYGISSILPEKAYPMAGYDLRTATAEGVHDPLSVRVLFLKAEDSSEEQTEWSGDMDGGNAACSEVAFSDCCLVIYDLLGVPEYLVKRVQEAVSRELGLSTGQVTVSAIHTHAAPKSHFRSFRCYDPAYEELLVTAGVKAAARAKEDLCPRILTSWQGTVPGVGSFRDAGREDSRFDMPVDGLILKKTSADNSLEYKNKECDATGATVASEINRIEKEYTGRQAEDPEDVIGLFIFRCHPTVLNEDNFLMSRDLVWGMEQALRRHYPNARLLFLNGAAADISTRYSRQESSFRECERLGEVFADCVSDAFCSTDFAGSIAYSVDSPQDASRDSQKTPGETYYDKETFLSGNQLPACHVSCLSTTLTIPPATFFSREECQEILAYLEQKIATCKDFSEKREYIACQSVIKRPNYGLNSDGSPKGETTVTLGAVRLQSKRDAEQDPVQGEGNAAHEAKAEGVDLIFLPFEYAFKDERQLVAAVKAQTGRHAIVVCYSGGYEGYLPSGRPLDRDSGYEDMASGYRHDAKELVKKAVLELLSRC